MAVGSNITLNVPNKESSDSIWIQFHKDLKSSVGAKNAQSVWVHAWTIRGSSAANTGTLRDYLNSEGISLSPSGVLGQLLDTTNSLLSGIGDIFSGGKYVAYAVVGIVVLGLGLLVYNVAKAPAESLGTAIKYAK